MSFANFMRKLDGKSPVTKKKGSRSSHSGDAISGTTLTFSFSDVYPGDPVIVDSEVGVEEEEWDNFDDYEDTEYESFDQEGVEQEDVQVTPAAVGGEPSSGYSGGYYYWYTNAAGNYVLSTSPPISDTPDGEELSPVSF